MVRGNTETSPKMHALPLLFNVVFATILFVALEKFSEDAKTFSDLAHLQERPSKVGPETTLECALRAIWGML